MTTSTPKPVLETLGRDELLATVRRLLGEADSLSSRISAVNEIGVAMNQTLDLDTIQRVVAKQAKWLLDFAHLSVCLRDKDSWRITTLFGPPEAQPGSLVETANLGNVLKTGQPCLNTEGSPSPFLAAYASQMIVPLSADNTLLGTINFAVVEPRRYTQDDMRIGYMLSLQLSAAIRNANILAELQRTQAELNMRLEELDAYSHTIAHDLKTPLSSILLWADLFRITHAPHVSPEALDNVRVMKDSAQLMNRMIDQLLWLAKLRHTSQSVTSVAVRPVINTALKRFTHLIAERPITVSVAPDIPDALGHAQWIEEIFANLISNAIKYIGAHNPTPRITLSGVAQGETIRYEVRDNGVGIKPEDQARLFEKFSRLYNAEAEGLGLGLSIIRRMILKLNGTIGIDSTVGEGSTFWFTLPAPPAPPTTTRLIAEPAIRQIEST